MIPPSSSPSADSPVAQQLAFAILATLCVLTFATFRDYGITWDEEVQNMYGNMLLALYTSGFQDRSALSFMNLYFYGGFFDLCTAIVNQFTPFDIYGTRHLLGGLMGVVGYIGVWRLTKLLAGEWAALAALAILATTPLLYGHTFVNPKDAPFAWLTVWVLYYGCRALMEAPRPRRSTILGFGIALGLALGTRILAIAWILAFLGTVGVGVIATHMGTPRIWVRTYLQHVKPLLWAMPLAVALMAIFWPWSVTAPFNLGIAIKEFSHFPWTSQVLWDGKMVMSNNLPPEYLPLLLLIQLPELILLGLIPAAGFALAVLGQSHIKTFTQKKSLAYLFTATTTLGPIFACVILHPTLYNGMRHFLFVVPLLGILAAIGLVHGLHWVALRHRAVAMVGTALLGIGVARQAWIAADLHPNQYVYYNALIGDLAGADGKFELDYWGSSLAEASRAVSKVMAEAPQTPPGGWKVQVCANRKSVMYFLPETATVVDTTAEADFYVGLRAIACDKVPQDGRTIINVTRRGAILSEAIDLRKPLIPQVR